MANIQGRNMQLYSYCTTRWKYSCVRLYCVIHKKFFVTETSLFRNGLRRGFKKSELKWTLSLSIPKRSWDTGNGVQEIMVTFPLRLLPIFVLAFFCSGSKTMLSFISWINVAISKQTVYQTMMRLKLPADSKHFRYKVICLGKN